ncbi:hypothetical protein NN3_11780 [Nocardia neocaledoniensis NBRC 108232]|nr:hypothetical protein NN3_11780 [Nocardia neocaledoniensis NBRC 108232]
MGSIVPRAAGDAAQARDTAAERVRNDPLTSAYLLTGFKPWVAPPRLRWRAFPALGNVGPLRS